MSPDWVRLLRRSSLAILGLVIVVSVGAWWWTLERLPRVIRIAAGHPGGAYDQLAKELARLFEQDGQRVEILKTTGSVQNADLLRNGKADLGIIQGGSIPFTELAAIAPLEAEPVHVLIRRGSTISSMEEIRGEKIVIGSPGSGMRESALQVLQHFQLGPPAVKVIEQHFVETVKDPSVAVAIVTTSFHNHDLRELLRSELFSLVEIPTAEALSWQMPHFRPIQLPAGLYHVSHNIPDQPLKTVATTSFLVTQPAATQTLVRETLQRLYERDLSFHVPSQIPSSEALSYRQVRWHDEAKAYFDPFDHLGYTANLMESLAAVKELLVALAALLFLVWERWRRFRETRQQVQLDVLKDRLDQYLEQTVSLEQAQLTTHDPLELRRLLDDLSRVKLQAIQELTHEDLRGDRLFSIFLAQCGNLSSILQAKLLAACQLPPQANPTPAAEKPPDSH